MRQPYAKTAVGSYEYRVPIVSVYSETTLRPGGKFKKLDYFIVSPVETNPPGRRGGQIVTT
eukprot:SAG31_NODE_868_length_11355_cov_4.658582_6_plen_61_part_00